MPPNFDFLNSSLSDAIVLFDGNWTHWIKEHGYRRWYWIAILGDISLSASGIWLSLTIFQHQLDGGVYVFIGIMISLAIPPFLIAIPFLGIMNRKMSQDTMEHLAAVTGYSFSLSAPAGTMQGSLAGTGRDNRVFNILSGIYKSHPMRSYEYSFKEGYGKDERYYQYAITEIQFAKTLPRLQLVNAANVNFPHNDMKNLKLEGDFQRHFLLFAPEGNEIEDLQIFAPNFMQSLIDNYPDITFECVGNTLYLYNGLANTMLGRGNISKKNFLRFYAELDFLISALGS